MRSALTKAGCFDDLETDTKTTSATFTVSADVDFKKKLDEIVAGGNTHVKGYKVEKTTPSTPAKSDGASIQNSGSMQFVAVNKTSDCCSSKKACCDACETGDDSNLVTVSTVAVDEEKKEEKAKTKTVSLKLPNMT